VDKWIQSHIEAAKNLTGGSKPVLLKEFGLKPELRQRRLYLSTLASVENPIAANQSIGGSLFRGPCLPVFDGMPDHCGESFSFLAAAAVAWLNACTQTFVSLTAD
jgi:hypothetical protein